MKLVTNKDIQKSLGIEHTGFLGNVLGASVMNLLSINRINNVYEKVYNYRGQEFFDELLQELGVKIDFHEEDVKRIPTEGAFVVVSNHPLGALDGIIMTKIVSSVRPDFKVMGNFLLKRIEPLSEYVIPVNPFETRKGVFDSSSGLKQALGLLQSGGCLGIFPAGEVSFKDSTTGSITDREWQKTAIKLIKKAGVPVIPLYFHAKNSKSFYRFSKLNPNIQTALLPREMLKKRVKPIKLRIGKSIPLKELEKHQDVEELSAFLRKKVYMLKSFYDDRSKLFQTLRKSTQIKINSKPKEIIPPVKKHKIIQEINTIRNHKNAHLFTNNQYEVFFSKADLIPNIIREIGRLREITFRLIGEGSNKSMDLDSFDSHYHHLFLWDNEAEKIVGAYRMTLGQEIYPKYGIRGFYTSSLFNFDSEIHPFFRKTIEMGRAFIIPEYQQRPMPLFLLWKGIVHVCLRNPDHKYLMGGVSISNKFSNFSKSLMIEFMRSHYFDAFVAQFVHSKKEYKVRLKDFEKEAFLQNLDNDLSKFDKIIDEIEPNLRLPVLIKKYFKQNAKVIAFNVDPKFNDAIDGLMYIRISEIPENTVKPVMDEMQKELEEQMKSNSSN
ncbi:MAG: lysophospholipid acyltransferase family protein [Flavobacteriales bacterium]|nr:lysophospholipid acyltransferase family protein [Flavobacteriales bacterium]